MKERGLLLPALAVILALIFAIKLLSIQVFSKTHKQAARSNSTQRIKERAHRGHMMDRNGRLLVYNVPIYDILVTPKEVKHLDTAAFCLRFGIERSILQQRLADAARYSYIKPSYVLGPLYEEEFAAVQGYIRDFSGFHVRARNTRGYSYPSLAHALGYMGEISRKALKQDSSNYYTMGDLKGISGLEAQYESVLRGQPGFRYEMIDARGKTIGAFAEGEYDTLSKPGKDITLSIDIDLQRYAEELMQNRTGSIVALEPATGEVLCFVSAPSYDPRLLSGRNFTSNYAQLQADSLRPLFNRPLQAMYRPGSIFKIAQALVALQEKAISTESSFSCDQRIIGCHPHAPKQQLLGAIQHSCNPYFFRVMQQVIQPQGRAVSPYKQASARLEVWTEYMHSMGFGQLLGLDIPFTQSGFVPHPSYYDKIYGPLRWKYSNIYSISIGEGENLVLPIQMANFAAIVANKGYYYLPHFLRDPRIAEIYQKQHLIPIDEAHFDTIHEGMQMAVDRGTGWRSRIPGINVCGKNGKCTKQRPRRARSFHCLRAERGSKNRTIHIRRALRRRR